MVALQADWKLVFLAFSCGFVRLVRRLQLGFGLLGADGCHAPDE